MSIIDHNLRGIIPLQDSATQTQNVIPMGKQATSSMSIGDPEVAIDCISLCFAQRLYCLPLSDFGSDTHQDTKHSLNKAVSRSRHEHVSIECLCEETSKLCRLMDLVKLLACRAATSICSIDMQERIDWMSYNGVIHLKKACSVCLSRP